MAASPQPDGNGSVDPTPKPGFLTTEFWATLATLLMPVAILVFHRDFSDQVQTIATAAAGIATAVYTLSRALAKSSQARAVASMTAVTAAAGVRDSAGQAGAAQAATKASQVGPEVQAAAAKLAAQLRGENGARGQDTPPTITVIAV